MAIAYHLLRGYAKTVCGGKVFSFITAAVEFDCDALGYETGQHLHSYKVMDGIDFLCNFGVCQETRNKDQTCKFKYVGIHQRLQTLHNSWYVARHIIIIRRRPAIKVLDWVLANADIPEIYDAACRKVCFVISIRFCGLYLHQALRLSDNPDSRAFIFSKQKLVKKDTSFSVSSFCYLCMCLCV